jgi:hypothetical protein
MMEPMGGGLALRASLHSKVSDTALEILANVRQTRANVEAGPASHPTAKRRDHVLIAALPCQSDPKLDAEAVHT